MRHDLFMSLKPGDMLRYATSQGDVAYLVVLREPRIAQRGDAHSYIVLQRLLGDDHVIGIRDPFSVYSMSALADCLELW